jgi:transposase
MMSAQAMQQADNGILTIGVDLGDKRSHYCVLGKDGKVMEQGVLTTTPLSFERHFLKYPRSLVVIEVCFHSRWVSQIIEHCGHEVLVANACKVKLITQANRKNDRIDACTLARLARADRRLLFPIRHRSEEAQMVLACIRSRDALVRARTRLVNCIRGMVKPTGLRLPMCSTGVFHRRVPDLIPPRLRPAVGRLLEQIANLNRAILEYEREIDRMAREQYPETEILQQVHGVGPLTALAFIVTLDDRDRFTNSRQVGCYLGLQPKQRQSGESNPQMGIGKDGDPYLRTLMVQAAHYILGPFGQDSDLRRWGLMIAASGGARGKKRAIIAVARKLAVLLHRLWVTGEVYEPLRNGATLSAVTL